MSNNKHDKVFGPVSANPDRLANMSSTGDVVVADIGVKKSKTDTKEWKLRVSIDFTGVERHLLLKWAFRHKIISTQRMLRLLEPAFLDDLEKRNCTLAFTAVNCGQKLVDPDEAMRKIQQQACTMEPSDLAKLIEQLKEQHRIQQELMASENNQ